MLYAEPSLFGLFTPHAGAAEFFDHLGLLWLVLGIAGLLFRVVQLFVVRDVQTGLVWAVKILTDPFNDFLLYHRSPSRLVQHCLSWRPARLR